MTKRGRPKQIYILYEHDRFIGTGTIDELAELVDRKPATVKFWRSKQYKVDRHGMMMIETLKEDS